MSKFNDQIGGDHYRNMTLQPIEYILKNNLNFCEGNVIKYITRYKDKNGIEDLNKEKVLKAAKKKGKELQDKAEDLVKLAKEKGTPVLEGMANDLREKVISAAQEVIDKLEEK